MATENTPATVTTPGGETYTPDHIEGLQEGGNFSLTGRLDLNHCGICELSDILTIVDRTAPTSHIHHLSQSGECRSVHLCPSCHEVAENHDPYDGCLNRYDDESCDHRSCIRTCNDPGCMTEVRNAVAAVPQEYTALKHPTSGEEWAVLLFGGEIVRATGPLSRFDSTEPQDMQDQLDNSDSLDSRLDGIQLNSQVPDPKAAYATREWTWTSDDAGHQGYTFLARHSADATQMVRRTYADAAATDNAGSTLSGVLEFLVHTDRADYNQGSHLQECNLCTKVDLRMEPPTPPRNDGTG